ncbi:MAG: D-2-hydroxyacid dehydrogenase [Spirosoma sp.]|nr:D-2-hydroxyacid dehydrogenase [Spirosoma sp.]
MTLFIYTQLSDDNRAYLLHHVPDTVTTVFRTDLAPTQQQAAFQDADMVLGNPPPAWWEQPPANLTFWQLDSAGFDGYRHLQPDAQVANMGDFFAWPCAETIVAGILAHYRHIDELILLQQKRQWDRDAVRYRLNTLRHKRVVILGAGTIAQATRQMLSGFGCSVQLMARTSPDAALHTADELRTALPNTDLVVSTLPGTANNFFSADLIDAMKPGSVFANVGRGNTVDEAALIAALQRGHLAGAVLDVTATEPLPTDSPLWALPNVILTQHTAGGQPSEDQGKIDQFLRNLTRFQTGEPLENAVTLTRGY